MNPKKNPLIELLRGDRQAARFERICEVSDGLKETERLEAVRALRKSDLARLFALAEVNTLEVTTAFLVPDTTPPHHTVEWVGKNSLPAFSSFTKRFTRSELPGMLVGHNTGSAQGFVGPGYFLVHPRLERPSELLFDYTRYPAQSPPGWPALRRNESGLSRFVFFDMHDHFRPVGRHLGIGAAFSSRGEFKGQFFALTRGAVLPIGF